MPHVDEQKAACILHVLFLLASQLYWYLLYTWTLMIHLFPCIEALKEIIHITIPATLLL